MFTVRYFSFLDAVNGELTKGYGYSYSFIKQNVIAKRTDTGVKIIKNDSEEEVRNVLPRNEAAVELSKAEFDALDISGESFLSRLSREKQVIHLKKLERRFIKDPVIVTNEEIKKKFK